MLWGVAVEIAALAVLILVPSLRHVFGLVPVGFQEWGLLLLFPPVMLALEEGEVGGPAAAPQ